MLYKLELSNFDNKGKLTTIFSGPTCRKKGFLKVPDEVIRYCNTKRFDFRQASLFIFMPLDILKDNSKEKKTLIYEWSRQ